MTTPLPKSRSREDQHVTTSATRTDRIQWTGHNLADVQAFVGPRLDYDRSGLPTQTDGFTVQPDGTGRMWLEDEKTWIDVPVGHRIYRDLLDRRWAISPQALAATVDPVVAAVMKPVDTVQDTGRRAAGLFQRMRRRLAL